MRILSAQNSKDECVARGESVATSLAVCKCEKSQEHFQARVLHSSEIFTTHSPGGPGRELSAGARHAGKGSFTGVFQMSNSAVYGQLQIIF